MPSCALSTRVARCSFRGSTRPGSPPTQRVTHTNIHARVRLSLAGDRAGHRFGEGRRTVCSGRWRSCKPQRPAARRLYKQRDLMFAQELARRAGNAVERSRQYTREVGISPGRRDDQRRRHEVRSVRPLAPASRWPIPNLTELLGYSDAAEVEGCSFLEFRRNRRCGKVETQQTQPAPRYERIS